MAVSAWAGSWFFGWPQHISRIVFVTCNLVQGHKILPGVFRPVWRCFDVFGCIGIFNTLNWCFLAHSTTFLQLLSLCFSSVFYVKEWVGRYPLVIHRDGIAARLHWVFHEPIKSMIALSLLSFAPRCLEASRVEKRGRVTAYYTASHRQGISLSLMINR